MERRTQAAGIGGRNPTFFGRPRRCYQLHVPAGKGDQRLPRTDQQVHHALLERSVLLLYKSGPQFSYQLFLVLKSEGVNLAKLFGVTAWIVLMLMFFLLENLTEIILDDYCLKGVRTF